jgi:hypothetical protein
MIDRETLLRCLDLAIRLNDDGEVDTVTAQAAALAEWLDAKVVEHRQRTVRRIEGVNL